MQINKIKGKVRHLLTDLRDGIGDNPLALYDNPLALH